MEGNINIKSIFSWVHLSKVDRNDEQPLTLIPSNLIETVIITEALVRRRKTRLLEFLTARLAKEEGTKWQGTLLALWKGNTLDNTISTTMDRYEDLNFKKVKLKHMVLKQNSAHDFSGYDTN